MESSLFSIYNDIQSQSVSILDTIETLKPNTNNESFNSIFCKDYILKHPGKGFDITVSVGHSHSVMFHLWFPNNNITAILPSSTSEKEFAEQVALTCSKWLAYAYTLRDTGCSDTLHVYMYLTNLKKKMPKTTAEVFDQQHVNTAFTYSCMKNNVIMLYRSEEFMKVFFHETFHTFGFDFSGDSELATMAANKIKEFFHIESEINVFETYAEMWATILGMLFQCNNTTTTSCFNKELKKQQKFAVEQCAKVLRHNGCAMRKFINKECIIQEKTNVASYYIFKAALLQNLKQFVEFVGGKVKQEWTEQKVKEFVEMIRENTTARNFVSKVERVRTKSGMNRTMKMTDGICRDIKRCLKTHRK